MGEITISSIKLKELKEEYIINRNKIKNETQIEYNKLLNQNKNQEAEKIKVNGLSKLADLKKEYGVTDE